MSKLSDLAEIYGFEDSTDLLLEYSIDSVCPAICTNKDCDYTTEMEPDQSKGWCENCETNTVASANVLAGII